MIFPIVKKLKYKSRFNLQYVSNTNTNILYTKFLLPLQTESNSRGLLWLLIVCVFVLARKETRTREF